MEAAVATIINGIFSEYGALVGGMILIILWQAKKIEKLENKNDALEKEVRETIVPVVTQNTMTFQRVENALAQPQQPRLEYRPPDYGDEDPPQRRKKPRGTE